MNDGNNEKNIFDFQQAKIREISDNHSGFPNMNIFEWSILVRANEHPDDWVSVDALAKSILEWFGGVSTNEIVQTMKKSQLSGWLDVDNIQRSVRTTDLGVEALKKCDGPILAASIWKIFNTHLEKEGFTTNDS